MDEFAMSYEYIIRRANKCGRYGVAGANADIYRGFERAYAEFQEVKSGQPRFTTKSLEQTISNYMCRCGEISGYILTAVDKVRRDYQEKITKKQDRELQNIEVLLISPDIEKIKNSIKKAENIMIEIGLYPQ